MLQKILQFIHEERIIKCFEYIVTYEKINNKKKIIFRWHKNVEEFNVSFEIISLTRIYFIDEETMDLVIGREGRKLYVSSQLIKLKDHCIGIRNQKIICALYKI